MIYLDNNATTKIAPEVLSSMQEVSEIYGNASSVHSYGQHARRLINEAREQMAAAFKIPESTLYFSSGGTESINSAILGAFLPLQEKSHLIVSKAEHASVLRSAEYLESLGVELSYIELDAEGRINLEALEAAIRPHTRMIAVMFANNEIGNIYPIKKIGEIARSRGVLYFCDAVQAVGRFDIDLSQLPIDMLAGAAHKFHGPKGAAFMYVKKGLKLVPILHGGRQERGIRPGTENVSAIVGMAKALDLALKNQLSASRKIQRLRDKLESGLIEKIPGLILHGDHEHRLDNTLNFRIKGVSGESLLINLDQAGIAVSVGAACDSGSLEPSHVLLAMGLSEQEALGGLRFSLSRYNSDNEIDEVLEKLPGLVEQVRS